MGGGGNDIDCKPIQDGREAGGEGTSSPCGEGMREGSSPKLVAVGGPELFRTLTG